MFFMLLTPLNGGVWNGASSRIRRNFGRSDRTGKLFRPVAHLVLTCTMPCGTTRTLRWILTIEHNVFAPMTRRSRQSRTSRTAPIRDTPVRQTANVPFGLVWPISPSAFNRRGDWGRDVALCLGRRLAECASKRSPWQCAESNNSCCRIGLWRNRCIGWKDQCAMYRRDPKCSSAAKCWLDGQYYG